MHRSYALFFLAAAFSIFVGHVSGQGGVVCSPDDAFLHNNNWWYQFFDCPQTWQQAQATCRRLMRANGQTITGGNLVSILDRAEADWLQFALNQRYGRALGVWIGLRRIMTGNNPCNNGFAWSDGSAITFLNWASGQPNCRWPNEYCVHLINDNFLWNDAECQIPMRFVCKARRSGSNNFDVSSP